MQLILRPVSDTRLQEIIVTDTRFAIGRNEPYFKEYDRSVVQRLSRRHARVFERDGCVYVADLNSSNGTSVNGVSVEDEPVQLHSNDELEFGGLRYRVDHLAGIDAGTVRSDPAVEAKIVLEPARDDRGLAPIVISKFPYMIGRHASAFADYQQSAPDQLSQLSKKHAHFFIQNGAVYIEDLGSTNGTFVCNERLAEKARELVHHDTVAFGGDFFVYGVSTFIGEETVAEAEPRIESMAEGTIFVDDATNFFEIYMDAGGKDVDAGRVDEQKATDAEDKADGAGKTAVNRRLRFLQSLRGALTSGEPLEKRLRWTVVLAVAVLAVGIAGYWYLTWPEQAISRQIDNEQFLAAATSANEYLQGRPNDERLQDLATVATLKAYVPKWQTAMERGDFATATRVLGNASNLGSPNPQDDALIEALELATRITATGADDGADDLSIGALSGDESVSTLITEWDARESENRLALSRVETYVDGFNSFHADFYTILRKLRDQEKGSLPLQELRSDIVVSLGDRNITQLRQQLKAFADQYPDVQGLELLQDDMRRYESVEQHIIEGRWLNAYDLINASAFHTAPFADHAKFMNAEILPDGETRAAYELGIAAWKEGDYLESFEILGALEQRRWGNDATALIERNRFLLTSWLELEETRGAEGFEDRLFELYGQLDPDLDAFLQRSLLPDFQQHSQAALVRAAGLLDQAEQSWLTYDRAGRLGSMHRLEERITDGFSDLAGQLTQAYRLLRESESIYRLLDADTPENWTTLNESIVQEIKLQTRAIGDLLVIEPDVRQAKLDLLPDLSGS